MDCRQNSGFGLIGLRAEVSGRGSVAQSIHEIDILKRFTELDLGVYKVDIFGELVKLDSPLKEGDRIEIFRPITAATKTIRRRATDDDHEDDD